MQVSIDGLFSNISGAMGGSFADGYRYTLKELRRNLAELSRRRDEGTEVIDEFFQCYSVREGDDE